MARLSANKAVIDARIDAGFGSGATFADSTTFARRRRLN